MFRRLVLETVVPLLMMTILPQLVILLPYIVVQQGGSISGTFAGKTVVQVLKNAWSSVDWTDRDCWLIVVGTFLWTLITLATLPGKMYHGPPTKANYRPRYWNNVVPFYLLTMALAIPVISYCSVLHLYAKFTTLMGILNVLGLCFALFLFVKGHLSPSPGEHGSTGNPIFDFYWGMELYPQLGPYINIKLFIINRFGLTLWQLIVLAAWKANYELHGHHQWPMTASAIVQSAYLAKGFYWEDGYMQSFDITTDRLGFYIGWGSVAVMPSLYPLASLYFVEHCPGTRFDTAIGIGCILLGLGSIVLGYWTDYQRQVVRETDGQCLVWGRKPKLIHAKYLDDKGTEHRSILLVSGFWGVARHLNYLFEILTYLPSALPALWYSPLPYVITTILTVLLLHRTFRDDAKCAAKYGQYWIQYCQLVPYKMVPGLF